MPVNCAFSFTTELLAGNQNIVRLPAKPYAQVDLCCGKRSIGRTAGNEAVCGICKFPPVQEISDYFSSLCVLRIVWGGDMTIAEMKKLSLPPRVEKKFVLNWVIFWKYIAVSHLFIAENICVCLAKCGACLTKNVRIFNFSY